MTPLKRIMKELNLSASWLANATGLARCTIYEYMENDIKTVPNIRKIAYVLGVSTDELLGMEEYIDNYEEEAEIVKINGYDGTIKSIEPVEKDGAFDGYIVKLERNGYETEQRIISLSEIEVVK